jgi:hypothetical protein
VNVDELTKIRIVSKINKMKKIFVFIIISNLISGIKISTAQTAGDYRSFQTGAWNAASSWETFNGTFWIGASASPASTNGNITIDTGHVITSSTSLTVDQVIISYGSTLNISGGTFTVADGPGTDLNCKGTLTFSSGIMDGAGLTEVQSGCTFNWTGGTLGGSGTLSLKANAVSTISFSSGHYIADTRIINNYGTLNWNSSNLNYQGMNPAIYNYGTFNINTDDDFGSSASSAIFINQTGGIINKTGSSTDETFFNGSGPSTFINDGIINVISGRLRINPSWANVSISFTNSGEINVASGAAMSLSGNMATFAAGSIFTGAGTADFSGAIAIFNATASLTTNTINVSAGSLTVDNACAVATTNITVSGGTFTLNPSLTLGAGGTLILSGGIFNGASTLNIPAGGTFSWEGGTLGGNGTLNLNLGGLYTISYGFGLAHYLADTRTLNNYDTLDWNGSFFKYQGTNPTFNNYGTFNINSDYALSFEGGGRNIYQ